MALIVPLVAARKRTPSSTAAVSFADRLAGTVSGPQRLQGQAYASGAARRVVATAERTRTSREGPAALRFMWVVGLSGNRGISIATRRVHGGGRPGSFGWCAAGVYGNRSCRRVTAVTRAARRRVP